MRELSEAVRWIARDNKRAALGLRSVISDTLERIGRYPLIGVERPDLARAPMRFLWLSAYPYVLIYNSGRTPPTVNRVVHTARDLPTVLGAVEDSRPAQ